MAFLNIKNLEVQLCINLNIARRIIIITTARIVMMTTIIMMSDLCLDSQVSYGVCFQLCLKAVVFLDIVEDMLNFNVIIMSQLSTF